MVDSKPMVINIHERLFRLHQVSVENGREVFLAHEVGRDEAGQKRDEVARHHHEGGVVELLAGVQLLIPFERTCFRSGSR